MTRGGTAELEPVR